MDLHLLDCYGALVFALGLIEVAAVIPYEVISLKSGNFRVGAGCIAHLPTHRYFEYIGGTYHDYEKIKKMWLEAGNDIHKLRDVDDVIAKSLNKARIPCETDGEHFYDPESVTSCKYSYTDNSLRFRYGNKEVEIIFTKETGLKALIDILSGKGKICETY